MPRELNVSFPVGSGVDALQTTIQLITVGREGATFELDGGNDMFYADPNSFKVTMYANGNVIGAAKTQRAANTFALGLRIDLPPYRGFVPNLLPSSESAEERIDELPFEGTDRVVRVRTPLKYEYDGNWNHSFYFVATGFIDVEQVFDTRACPQHDIEFHTIAFESSLKLDPSFSIITGDNTFAKVGNEEMTDTVAPLLEPSPEGLPSGAVAAIVIVVLIVIMCAVIGAVALRRKMLDNDLSDASSGAM